MTKLPDTTRILLGPGPSMTSAVGLMGASSSARLVALLLASLERTVVGDPKRVALQRP